MKPILICVFLVFVFDLIMSVNGRDAPGAAAFMFLLKEKKEMRLQKEKLRKEKLAKVPRRRIDRRPINRIPNQQPNRRISQHKQQPIRRVSSYKYKVRHCPYDYYKN